MRLYILFLIGLIFSSCTKDSSSYIKHINGYWEIQEVQLANGKTHQYTINETIDFISLNDSLIGFRKKLKPDFSGTYTASNDFESITLKIENDSLNIYYKTALSNWKETVLYADNEQLKIITPNKDVYLYKRWTQLKKD